MRCPVPTPSPPLPLNSPRGTGARGPDIHFHYKRALEAAVAKPPAAYQPWQHRQQPGTRGRAGDQDHGCAIRIGVNAGSLGMTSWKNTASPAPQRWLKTPRHLRLLQDHDFHEVKISVKASDVFLAVAAYHGLAESCDYPLISGSPRLVACVSARSNRRCAGYYLGRDR